MKAIKNYLKGSGNVFIIYHYWGCYCFNSSIFFKFLLLLIIISITLFRLIDKIFRYFGTVELFGPRCIYNNGKRNSMRNIRSDKYTLHQQKKESEMFIYDRKRGMEETITIFRLNAKTLIIELFLLSLSLSLCIYPSHDNDAKTQSAWTKKRERNHIIKPIYMY